MSGNPTPYFAFPANAFFGKKITKEKIYQYANPSAAVKQKFIRQIDKIIWQYKLAPETINIAAAKHLVEIQVLDITLKDSAVPAEVDEALLRVIDKAISMPLYYRIFAAEQVKLCMAYKRPSESDGESWVVDAYFSSAWLNVAQVERNVQPMPLALSMQALYEQLLRSLILQPAKPGESLSAQVQRLSQVRELTKLIQQLTHRLTREKQFNHQIDINRQINQLKSQLELLTA